MKNTIRPLCSVSRQPVLVGDEVRLVPIRRQASWVPTALKATDAAPTADRAQRHDTFWRPESNFIAARYSDQGFVFDSEPANREPVLQLFQLLHAGSCYASSAREPDFKDIAAEHAPQLSLLLDRKPPLTNLSMVADLAELQACWSRLWPGARPPQINLRDSAGWGHPFSFSVMHATAYDALIALRSTTDEAGKCITPRGYFDEALAQAHAKAQAGDPALLTPAAQRAFEQHLWKALTRRARLPFDDRRRNVLTLAYTSGELSADAFFQAIESWLRNVYALAGLDLVHVTLSPMTLADSQDDASWRYVQLMRKVQHELPLARMR